MSDRRNRDLPQYATPEFRRDRIVREVRAHIPAYYLKQFEERVLNELCEAMSQERLPTREVEPHVLLQAALYQCVHEAGRKDRTYEEKVEAVFALVSPFMKQRGGGKKKAETASDGAPCTCHDDTAVSVS